MKNAQQPAPDLRLFTWIPVATPPTPEEALAEDHTLLLAIQNIGIAQGAYTPEKNQFYQHCERYDSFDDEPVPGWTREQQINNYLEWEMEEVYPEGHEEADWGTTVTHWMLVPNPPTEPA